MPPPEAPHLAAWLAAGEAEVSNLRPHCARRIHWAGPEGEKTPVSVVYIHGFSASGAEISPVPERLATALGANLYLARLPGHGRDGASMAEPGWRDWLADTRETLEIGRRLGGRVIAMSCSTGGTLVAMALAERAEDVAGAIFVSPNAALKSPLARVVLGLPGVRHWGPLVMGRERRFEPANAEHAAHWTPRYPLVSVLAVRDTVRALRRIDPGDITVPALVLSSQADRVVSTAHARRVFDRWGGPVQHVEITPGPGDDPNAHVIAGDILSPGQTDRVTKESVAWAERILD